MLRGKKILLGVSGSIAAYKSAHLTRLLIKSGCDVKVVMTPDAMEFITPLTLATLSKQPIYSEFVADENGEWNNHVELGLWADLMIIAPATANTIAKMSNGICDNLLMATYLSAKCPVMFAPAMDLDMYKHQTTKQNIDRLLGYNNIFIKPGSGELASGLEGEGRMAEPEEIIAKINLYFDDSKKPLYGKKVIITAGPTYEAIDPVRFIGNHSSGKMGFAIAEAVASQGAEVVLISGPSNETIVHNKVKRVNIVSAEEMYNAAINEYDDSDVAILSAAVADYKPKLQATEKIKKANASLTIELEPTKDILATLGERKKNQFLVGFALETNNEKENAKKKLIDKNLDFIVLNSLNDKGAGFGVDTNKITILDNKNEINEFPLMSKKEVAEQIVNKIIAQLNA